MAHDDLFLDALEGKKVRREFSMITIKHSNFYFILTNLTWQSSVPPFSKFSQLIQIFTSRSFTLELNTLPMGGNNDKVINNNNNNTAT